MEEMTKKTGVVDEPPANKVPRIRKVEPDELAGVAAGVLTAMMKLVGAWPIEAAGGYALVPWSCGTCDAASCPRDTTFGSPACAAMFQPSIRHMDENEVLVTFFRRGETIVNDSRKSPMPSGGKVLRGGAHTYSHTTSGGEKAAW